MKALDELSEGGTVWERESETERKVFLSKQDTVGFIEQLKESSGHKSNSTGHLLHLCVEDSSNVSLSEGEHH